jgi:tetratricopeptide (TPR) repeat protein
MKPSNELFDLIKSLTKSEKRFFKLSSSIQTGEKNYLKIFDYIDGQEEYDEAKLKDYFKDERFIKHLPSEKNHLYKLILKSLRQFYGEQSVSSILKQELKNIEILYNKALFKECKKFLKRAKRVAHEHEKFYFLIDLISWEKQLTEESYESGDFNVDLKKIIEEESEVINKLRNLAEYHILYSRINAIFRSGGFTRNDEERATVHEISDNYLIKGKNTAISTRAASICYYIKGLCAATNREFSDSYTFFNRTKQILDKNPKIRIDLGKRYILTLFHLMRCYIDERNFVMAQKMLDEIKSLNGKKGFNSLDLTLKILNISVIDQMNLHNLQGDFNKALEVYETRKNEKTKIFEKSSKEQQIKFLFNAAYTLFGVGEYKKALKVLNDILNDNEQKLRQDLYSFARILNLLIHFELENYEFLEYSSNSAIRYLNKIKRDYEIETVFAKQMRKLARTATKLESITIYKETLEQVQNLLKDDNERVILDYIDIQCWLQSKITEDSFVELVKSKVKA